MLYTSVRWSIAAKSNYVKPPEFCDAEGLNPHLWIRDTSAATTGGLSGFEGSSSTWAQVAVTKRRCKETSSPILSTPSPQVNEQEPQKKRRGLRDGITDLVGLRGNNPWSKSNRVDKSNGTAAQNDAHIHFYEKSQAYNKHLLHRHIHLCVSEWCHVCKQHVMSTVNLVTAL